MYIQLIPAKDMKIAEAMLPETIATITYADTSINSFQQRTEENCHVKYSIPLPLGLSDMSMFTPKGLEWYYQSVVQIAKPFINIRKSSVLVVYDEDIGQMARQHMPDIEVRIMLR